MKVLCDKGAFYDSDKENRLKSELGSSFYILNKIDDNWNDDKNPNTQIFRNLKKK
jgi:hypothetical protein